jgi:translation initiation factor 3 subunit M
VGLLTGKLAQPAQTLRVTRATARVFGPPEWELLVKRLTAWRAGIAGVLDVVATGNLRNDAAVAVVAPGEKQTETPGEAEGTPVETAS